MVKTWVLILLTLSLSHVGFGQGILFPLSDEVSFRFPNVPAVSIDSCRSRYSSASEELEISIEVRSCLAPSVADSKLYGSLVVDFMGVNAGGLFDFSENGTETIIDHKHKGLAICIRPELFMVLFFYQEKVYAIGASSQHAFSSTDVIGRIKVR